MLPESDFYGQFYYIVFPSCVANNSFYSVNKMVYYEQLFVFILVLKFLEAS